jgi:beta-N-acetylhexosaminidase
MAVIATHFPGRGSADREPDEEIATVRKSLEQLKQIELYPFFAVTGNNEDAAEITDGLLLSHIRYQGFQGNIRATTKPVSFDAAALEQIMLLPEFVDWRSQGGVIVSDDLGTEAVRKFVDPLNTGYDARQVARSALLAGNDLLYLGNIIATGDPDSYTTVVRTIDYFVQKYQEDSAFQVRVDQAVLNILRLKLKLYPSLALEAILPAENSLEDVGTQRGKVEEIIQASASLINPGAEEIPAVLPDPPQSFERIVIISDLIPYRQCSTCTEQTIFPAQSLANSLVRLYGASAGDPIQAANIKVYSFESVRLILENAEEGETAKIDINAAQWLIFAFTEFSSTLPEAVTFQRLFNERPELVRNKKTIGMAFNAPYFLDATDISKFSAYYAFYSKVPEAFDVAARTLLQEYSPTGILPVSVPGIEYDLVEATSPDPNQMISLFIEAPEGEESVEATPPSDYSQPLLYKAGDTIPVRAGPILDNNGHPVPDGTVVRFLIDTRSISGSVEQLESQTIDGYARINYKIASIGSLELKATAEPALISQILRLDITNAGGVVTSYEPTIPVQVTQESTPTPSPTPTPQSRLVQMHDEGRLVVSDWLLANLLIFGAAILFNLVGSRTFSAKWKLFTILCLALGGNLGYLYFALGGSQAQAAISQNGTIYVLLIVLIGMLLGLGGGLLFYWIRRKKRKLPQQGN